MRTLFMSCVPLFLMISGYLLKNKKLSKKYYFGLVKIIFIYVVASVTYYVLSIYFGYEQYDGLKHSVGLLLSFDMDTHAWYIEMYIGLFLIIPFLNIIYNKLDSKRKRQALCITFIILTALPAVLNSFNFSSGNIFDTIFNGSGKYTVLFPDWWRPIWPITYYYLGSYLHDYPIKINKILNLAIVLIFIFAFGTYSYLVAHGAPLIWNEVQWWWPINNVLVTCSIFNFFLLFKQKDKKTVGKSFIRGIANCCFAGFLVSAFFDNVEGQFLSSLNLCTPDKLIYYFPCTICNFICSIIIAFFITVLFSLLLKCWKKISASKKK